MDQIKFEIWGYFVGQKGKKRKIAKKRNRNFWQSYRSQRAEILHSSLSHCYLHYNTNNTDRYIWSGLRHRQKNDPVCRLSCELLFAYWTNNFCEFNFGPLSTLKLQLSFGTLHLLFKRWGRPYSPNIWCRLGGGGGGGRHSQHHRRCQGGHQEEQSKELHGHKNSMCLWGYEIVFNTSVVVYSLSWRQGVPFLLVFSLNQTPFPSATSWAQTTNFHALLVPSALFFFLQTTTYVEQVLASVLKRPRERRYVVRT